VTKSVSSRRPVRRVEGVRSTNAKDRVDRCWHLPTPSDAPPGVCAPPRPTPLRPAPRLATSDLVQRTPGAAGLPSPLVLVRGSSEPHLLPVLVLALLPSPHWFVTAAAAAIVARVAAARRCRAAAARLATVVATVAAPRSCSSRPFGLGRRPPLPPSSPPPPPSPPPALAVGLA
jgi:hypothetical protein